MAEPPPWIPLPTILRAPRSRHLPGPRSDDPLADDLGGAFRSACHGGQLPAVPYLLSHRVDVDSIGYDGRPRWASL
ncbi:hypothetical protein [Streptomyces katrae]|uniref:hypothetical protein n=1 Tax=Streptomyces katrae TaxID=68223 RepID=UPI0004C268C6|nr:hypothetical protein [Streptomyces katrae]